MSGEPRRYCIRCGIQRNAKTPRTLCRDCQFVLSTEEKEKWHDSQKKVTLSHRTKAA